MSKSGPWFSFRQEVIGGDPVVTHRWITDDIANSKKEEVGPIAYDYIEELLHRLKDAGAL